ncbi:hypothetical protein C8F04DRAFT_1103451 [Mycena alexandri]|uniref:Uncharacterized protein n=1 Tax=Mycena alexandri TaxID=1745969 RepID=A0AAD6SU50_9AGAR|nr:hypothetical protein C8F04DRAFT_1103451 [Mycena alexandri]
MHRDSLGSVFNLPDSLAVIPDNASNRPDGKEPRWQNPSGTSQFRCNLTQTHVHPSCCSISNARGLYWQTQLVKVSDVRPHNMGSQISMPPSLQTRKPIATSTSLLQEVSKCQTPFNQTKRISRPRCNAWPPCLSSPSIPRSIASSTSIPIPSFNQSILYQLVPNENVILFSQSFNTI